MKSETDISLEQMAACMAHEIKNPLAMIKAHLQLLECEDSVASHKKNYDTISRELERIGLIMSDFIDITSSVKYDFAEIDLKDLIDDVLQCFDCIFVQKNIELSVKYSNKYNIYGNFNRLKQVLINVIKNSIEALDGNENSKIEISVLNKGGLVGINIIDNGVGISSEDCKKIGNPFFTTKKSGSGLGVLISKKIIEQHNGVFIISGEAGKGASVYFGIPAYKY